MTSLREIDIAIAKRVMGWDGEFDRYGTCRQVALKRIIDVPHYTTDVAQAFEALEKMRHRGFPFFIRGFKERFTVKVGTYSHWVHEGDEKIQTLSEAICRAVLAALEAT